MGDLNPKEAAERLSDLSTIANGISYATIMSWDDILDWKTLSAGDIAKLSPLKYASYKWPVVNPVTFGSIIRGFIDTEKSEGEKVGWKVANYGFTILDIAFGLYTLDPTVVIDIVGLAATFIEDIIQWDSLWGRDTTDYTERTLWLSRT